MLIVLLLACAPDLPSDWEDAEPVDDFSQEECDGSPMDTGWASTVSASAGGPGLRVVGDDLPFRCEQEVEGFYRTSGEAVDVLVQPVDMDPRSVAACDCLFRVRAGVPEDPPATVTLYRRWDNINDDNDPVLVGTAEVGP